MYGLFILLLALSGIAAQMAWRRYEAALVRGRKLVIPGGLTAGEVAQLYLEANDLPNVRIMQHDAVISDYMDSERKCLFLNSSVMNGTDAASLAIALHEAAHAVQRETSAQALRWRESTIRLTRYVPTLVPLALLLFTILRRFPFRATLMATAFVWFLIMVTSAMSLPIEFNASQRALAFLENKLEKYPRFVEAMTTLLRDVAFRDTGAFVRSPVYCLYGLLPMGGKLRPTK